MSHNNVLPEQEAVYTHVRVRSDQTDLFTHHSSLFVLGVQYSRNQWRNRPYIAQLLYADKIVRGDCADPFPIINPAPLRQISAFHAEQ